MVSSSHFFWNSNYSQFPCSTAKLKSMADLKVMTLDDSDALIRSFHLELQNGA